MGCGSIPVRCLWIPEESPAERAPEQKRKNLPAGMEGIEKLRFSPSALQRQRKVPERASKPLEKTSAAFGPPEVEAPS
jgi:hypothetical protein